jgi:hypothetical protein
MGIESTTSTRAREVIAAAEGPGAVHHGLGDGAFHLDPSGIPVLHSRIHPDARCEPLGSYREGDRDVYAYRVVGAHGPYGYLTIEVDPVSGKREGSFLEPSSRFLASPPDAAYRNLTAGRASARGGRR